MSTKELETTDIAKARYPAARAAGESRLRSLADRGAAVLRAAETPRGLAFLGLLTLALPLLLEDAWVRLVGMAGIYAILAVGLNIITGYAGLLSLGFAAFFGLGAYTYGVFASNQLGIHIPFWALLPVCVAVCVVAGVIIGAPAIRMRGDYLALVTLAFAQIAYLLFVNLDRPINITNGVNGLLGVDAPNILGHSLGSKLAIGPFALSSNQQYYYLTCVFLAVVILYSVRLRNSRLGRAWEAIREDEIAAVSLGINRMHTKLLAFMLGGAVAGLAGALSTAWQGSAFPDNFTINVSIFVLLIIVVGGVGSIPGLILGSLVLVILPETIQVLSLYREILWGVLMMVMMVFRPQGLLGVSLTTKRPPPRSEAPQPLSTIPVKGGVE